MGNGPSALHQATLSGELQQVRAAIQSSPGALDATEPTNGWTALHIAALKGHEVIGRELLARGCAPNLIDREGRTPLHLAAREGHAGVMRDLLRKGADPLRRDMAGKTPLDAALEGQQPGAVSLLSDALAGRGFPATPTGSPTVAYAAAQQQQQQQQGQPGSGSAYPAVPAPCLADDGWLSRLPPPPAGSGPMSSASAPSAPPASRVFAVPPQQQQQQQQHAAGVDYYEFLRPAGAAAPTAPPPDAPGIAAGQHAYPAIPSAVRPVAVTDADAQQQPPQPQGKQKPWWQRLGQPQQQQQQEQQPPQQQQQQEQQPPQQQAGAPPTVVPQPQPSPPPQPLTQQQQQQQQAAADASDDEEGGWGGGGGGAQAASGDDDDGWGGGGGGRSVAAAASSARPAAAAAASGAGASQAPDKRGGQQPPNINAAVGAAVSNAGKVAGAVGSIAVAGARQLLTGLMRPEGQAGGAAAGDDDDYEDDEAATWAGTPGRVYSYGQLAAATQGFSEANKLGAGGYGPVFRGVLDGLPVAIKLLDPAATGGQQGPREFQAEVGILSRLHHPHILLLIGCCPERCALVYELLEYGSLEHHLFNPGLPELQWQDRVRIACEVASALVFLHSAPEPIVHMDLKPGNLLLSRSLVCKVGDVGLSRLMPGTRASTTAGGGPAGAPVSTVMDTRLVGTPCYMDPEYLRTGRFGPKSDVYSLGVILLQMLTGLEASKVVPVVEAALARSQGDAASFASIVDPRAGPWPITEAASFGHLGSRCVALQRSERPDLRGEVLPALLQLAERSRLYASAPGGGGVRRSTSLSAGSQGPPSMMVCPITQDIMVDPVFAADGYTYEREAIAGWVATHSTSPMTNLPLPSKVLTPNLALRSAIREWQERQQQQQQRR